MFKSLLPSHLLARHRTGLLVSGAAAVLCLFFAVLWLSLRAEISENLKIASDTISFLDSKYAEKILIPENEGWDIGEFDTFLTRGEEALDKVSRAMIFGADQDKVGELKATVTLGGELFQVREKLGLTMDLGLMGSMRGNAIHTEILLLERQQWRPTTEWLYMRRYEKEYLERFDEASVEAHQKYGALLEQEIALSYLKKSDKDALTDRIKAYRQDFAAVAETIQKVHASTTEYKEKSARAQDILADFGNSLPQEKAGGTGGYLIGLLVVLGFLIIVALGSFFARAMYEPIRKLAQYMESLAAGNVQEEVPFKDCAGEVGKMAASVAVFKDSLMRQELLKQQQEAINQDQADYEQEAAAYIDKIVEEAEELSTCGQEIRSKAYEVMNVSLSVSEEMADTNSLVLRLAEKVDAIDSALYQINGSQSMEVTDRIKKQLKEIREGMNKAISKILLINDVILKVRGISKEMVVSAEGQGPATRGVVRGIRYVSSIAQERMTGNGRSN